MPLSFESLARSCVGLDVEVPVFGGERRRYVNLDTAATTPALRQVQEAVDRFLPLYSSVHRGAGHKSLVSTEVFDRCRQRVAEFVGASLAHSTVIFGKNTTEMVNKLSRRLHLAENDVVLLSDMEHHSNDLPWRKVPKVIRLPVDKRGALDLDQVEDELRRRKGRVRLLAVSGASNVTGHQPPIHELAVLAHRYGALILADCAQLAPHRRIDVLPPSSPGHLDFVVFSAHKMYAPYGVGALVGPRGFFDQSEPDDVGGGTVEVVTATRAYWAASPDRDEPGTPNLLGVVALARAIACLTEVGFDSIAKHERDLTAHALRRLADVPGLSLYGDSAPVPGEDRIGVIPFNLRGVNHALLATALSWEGGIGVRSGCFCAHPFIQRLLGIDDAGSLDLTTQVLANDRRELPGLVRMSFGVFSTEKDVDAAADLLGQIAREGLRGTYRYDDEAGEYRAEGHVVEVDTELGI